MRPLGGLVLGIGLLLVGVAEAPAAFTPVRDPPAELLDSGAEASHIGVLSRLYGGEFQQQGKELSNGTIAAARLHDAPDHGPVSLIDSPPSHMADQRWTGGYFVARTVGRFGSDPHSFGYIDEGNPAMISLFDVSGAGFLVSGMSDIIDAREVILRWARVGINGAHDSASSRRSDQVVSYYIEDLDDGVTTWLLFWEETDIPIRRSAYEPDYNDLVIEIRAAPTPDPLQVPEPSGVAIILLSAAGLLRRRTRRA